MDDFGVRKSVHAAPRVNQVSHPEGLTPYVWKAILCTRAVKLAEGGRDLV